jgi:BASS family bile acid:Na+ symporter
VDGALDNGYLVALVVALWGTGVALGAEHAASELLAPVRRAGLLGRVGVVDVVLLPLLVWALVQLLQVPDDYAIGLLLVGMASAGPLGIKAAQLAGADVPAAVSLVLVLEIANLVAIPFWAALLLPAAADVDPLDVLGTLLIMVVAPLAIGVASRRAAPRLAARAPRPLTLASNVGLAAVVVIVLARDADAVVESVGARVPLVAAVAVVAALALGWLAGGSHRPTRASASLVTGVRANGPALAIAAASFPDRTDVRVGAVVFALFSIVVSLATALVIRRRSSTLPRSEPFTPIA